MCTPGLGVGKSYKINAILFLSMSFLPPQTHKETIEKLRIQMHKKLDTFCDKLIPEDEDQVHIGLTELENSINETLVDTVVAHCEDNQESAPLLPEQQQELRNRLRSKVLPGQERGPEQDSEPEGSHSEGPEVQNPGESFYERVQRLFQEMLSRQKKIWQDMLASVCDIFGKVVKTIWSVVESFFSSVSQFFSSLCQA